MQKRNQVFLTIRYENVVPWGRSFDEYKRMFCLTEDDLHKSILGCGDGPANFNSTMHKNGFKAVSCDPIYRFTRDQLQRKIDETFDVVMEQTGSHLDKFRWDTIRSLEELGATRMKAMSDFLADYDDGKENGRYVYAELPRLPFDDRSFDLILSAHLMFFYSDNLTLDFHLTSFKEMCRVGKEIRIFPLLTVNGDRSEYITSVTDCVRDLGWNAEEKKVDYEFQINGNTMLVLTRDERSLKDRRDANK